MNKIFAIIFVIVFALSLDLNAQTVVKYHTDNGPYFGVKASRDSGGVFVTNWFDASAILGQTCYLADSIYGATADSLYIIIQGKQYVGDGTTIYTNIDTISNLKSGVVTLTTLSLSGWAPEIRLKSIAGGSSRAITAWFTLMSPTTNYLRERKRYGNLP